MMDGKSVFTKDNPVLIEFLKAVAEDSKKFYTALGEVSEAMKTGWSNGEQQAGKLAVTLPTIMPFSPSRILLKAIEKSVLNKRNTLAKIESYRLDEEFKDGNPEYKILFGGNIIWSTDNKEMLVAVIEKVLNKPVR